LALSSLKNKAPKNRIIKKERDKLVAHEISDRAEDYLRTIQKIINEKGFATTGNIASELNIKPGSVVEMLDKLNELDLVIHEKYGEIKLTKDGLFIAEVISKRHDTFRNFLEIIFVPQEVAVKDAHILEHKLDYKTILQFTKFVDFMTLEKPGVIKRWRKSFKFYCEKESKISKNKFNNS